MRALWLHSRAPLVITEAEIDTLVLAIEGNLKEL